MRRRHPPVASLDEVRITRHGDEAIIKYADEIFWNFEKGYQWTPRGDVLRCVIDGGGPDGEPVIHIDDHELFWEEFGRLLTTHAGWGMRIVFVPDDELHEVPRMEVGEPDER